MVQSPSNFRTSHSQAAVDYSWKFYFWFHAANGILQPRQFHISCLGSKRIWQVTTTTSRFTVELLSQRRRWRCVLDAGESFAAL